MTLPILLLIVVIGVSVVVGAVHLAGGSRIVPIPSEADALERLQLDYPDYSASSVYLSDDHRNALIFDNKEKTAGLVVVMGDRSLTRMLDQTMIKSIERRKNEIKLKLADLTLPAIRFICGDETVADSIAQNLDRIDKAGVNN